MHRTHALVAQVCKGGMQLAALKLPNLKILPLDVCNARGCMDVISRIKQDTGRNVTVLVNNAGLGASLQATEEMPEEATRVVMETNFFAVLRLIKLVLPEM